MVGFIEVLTHYFLKRNDEWNLVSLVSSKYTQTSRKAVTGEVQELQKETRNNKKNRNNKKTKTTNKKQWSWLKKTNLAGNRYRKHSEQSIWNFQNVCYQNTIYSFWSELNNLSVGERPSTCDAIKQNGRFTLKRLETKIECGKYFGILYGRRECSKFHKQQTVTLSEGILAQRKFGAIGAKWKFCAPK